MSGDCMVPSVGEPGVGMGTDKLPHSSACTKSLGDPPCAVSPTIALMQSTHVHVCGHVSVHVHLYHVHTCVQAFMGACACMHLYSACVCVYM